MNSDAITIKKCVEEYANSESSKRKKQKEKVFKKGILWDFSDQITAGWYLADLFDVTHLITCGVAKRPEYVEEGIPFLSAQNARPFKTNLNKIRYIDEETFKRITVGGKPEKGDILYTRVGNCGEAATIPYDFDFGVYVSLTLIKPNSLFLNSDYLTAFLNSRFGVMQASQGAIGIGLKNLNVDNVRRYKIPLPPLPEQKRIVEKLDSLLAQVDTIQQRLNNLPDIIKRFRQSVLAAAVSGKLTEQWRVGKKVGEWNWLTIGDVSTVATGSTPKKTDPSFWDSSDVPWLTSSVTGNEFCNTATQFVSNKAVKECRLKLFPSGSLLLAMYGEGKTRGQVTEITIDATCNQACAAILVDENKISKAFVKLRLLENYEATRMAAEGGNQPNLNLSKVRDISIPVPSTEEQTEIVRLVDQYFALADSLEKNLSNAKQRVDNLTQSILAKAFRGELVPQDANDEPAEQLLARIKAARLEAEKLEKAAKKAAKTSKAKKR